MMQQTYYDHGSNGIRDETCELFPVSIGLCGLTFFREKRHSVVGNSEIVFPVLRIAQRASFGQASSLTVVILEKLRKNSL